MADSYLFDDMAADAAVKEKNDREVAELTAKRMARSSDYETCKIAAENHVLSGDCASNLAKAENAIYDLTLKLGRGPTNHEVHEWINDPKVDRTESQRRISQLVSDGRAYVIEEKIRCECESCKKRKRETGTLGTLMRTWRIK